MMTWRHLSIPSPEVKTIIFTTQSSPDKKIKPVTHYTSSFIWFALVSKRYIHPCMIFFGSIHFYEREKIKHLLCNYMFLSGIFELTFQNKNSIEIKWTKSEIPAQEVSKQQQHLLWLFAFCMYRGGWMVCLLTKTEIKTIYCGGVTFIKWKIWPPFIKF